MDKNKYVKRSHISEKKFREIIKYFSTDIEATKIAKLTSISRVTINKYLLEIRKLIADFCEKESPLTAGEIEVDDVPP